MKLTRQFERSLLRQSLAVLFVLLMLGFGFIQAVHVHDVMAGQRSSPASHCSLCVVTHHAASVTPTNSFIAYTPEATILTALPPRAAGFLSVDAAYIRPPPQAL